MLWGFSFVIYMNPIQSNMDYFLYICICQACEVQIRTIEGEVKSHVNKRSFMNEKQRGFQTLSMYIQITLKQV